MDVPVMINYFIYTRMIGETPKWVHNFVFITPILGEKQIKDMGYTGEQFGVIISGLLICLVVLVTAGKKYVDKITKK
jgi:hypothetical protein